MRRHTENILILRGFVDTCLRLVNISKQGSDWPSNQLNTEVGCEL